MRFSLGFILAISLAGLQFLAITIVVTTSYLTSEKAMLDHARNLLAEAGKNASEHSSGFLEPAHEAAELASRVIENGIVSSDDVTSFENYLFESLKTEPQLSGIYYGDETGKFIYVMRSDGPGEYRTKIVQYEETVRSTQYIWRDTNFVTVHKAFDFEDTFDPRTRPWYKSANSTRATIWTDPYIFFSSQKPGISVAAPVLAGDSLKGVIGVDIEISTISNFLSQLTISDHGSALILNENGDVIAHPNIEQIIVKNADDALSFVGIGDIEDPVARTAFSGLASTGVVAIEQETSSEFIFQKDRYVSLLKPIQGTDLPWTIAIYAPENDFTQSIKDNRTRNIWLAAAISFVTALAGLALAEFILRPVRAFAVRTSLVSQGEMSASEPLPRTYKELKKANETLIGEIAQRHEADAKILELNRDLSHFSRVNLMGQMATGLAHELSQPLTAISQNVDAAITTAKQEPTDNTELMGILAELDDQAHRGGDILRALRGFVRKDQGEMAHFDFSELLRQTNRLMHHEAEAHSIEMTFDMSAKNIVFGSRIQIAQVLINLIRNAMEAIVDANSPTRKISIKTHPHPEHLEIRIEDTGPGIDPDVTLFKQFETSKKDGMGLGLSICRTIAEANGGRLWHDAKLKQITRFCLTLRISDEIPNENA